MQPKPGAARQSGREPAEAAVHATHPSAVDVACSGCSLRCMSSMRRPAGQGARLLILQQAQQALQLHAVVPVPPDQGQGVCLLLLFILCCLLHLGLPGSIQHQGPALAGALLVGTLCRRHAAQQNSIGCMICPRQLDISTRAAHPRSGRVQHQWWLCNARACSTSGAGFGAEYLQKLGILLQLLLKSEQPGGGCKLCSQVGV